MSHTMHPTKPVRVRSVDPDGKNLAYLNYSRYDLIDLVVDQLRACRDNLKVANAPQARKAVARAMKSVEGARRNANYHGWKGE